jgi:hypothetical protein
MAKGELDMCNDRKKHFMRRLIFVTLFGFSVLIWHQAFAWQTILNNPDGPDLFQAVATDSADNVIGAGLTTRANGDRGIVVAKFSGLDGILLWRVEIDGATNGDDEAFAVAVDSNDDVLAVGKVRNQDVPFDLIVVKLASSNGAELWRRIINGTADNDDVARSVAIDSANDIVVAGKITDAITSANFAVIKFSGADGTTQWTWTTEGDAHTVSVNSQNEVIAGGSTNVGFAVVKIDSNGGLVWRQEIPRLACCLDTVFSVALDSHDDVFAAGNRQLDFAAAKLSGNSGAVIWSRQISGTQNSGEQANRVAVDLNNDAVVAGFTRNTGTGSDFTVIKFSGTTGVTQWAQAIDGGAFGTGDVAMDLVTDGLGDVYVTGDIATDAFGAQDLAFLKFAGGNGSELWRHMAPLRSRGNALAIDSANNVVAGGEFFQNPGDPDLGAIKLDGTTGFDFPVDTAPPALSVSVHPSRLWPPNGQMVSVAVSGTITDNNSRVDATTAIFSVADEYGHIQASGPVSLGSGGSYLFTISLQASRRGNDRDGRQYTIRVSAEDLAGNPGSTSTVVTVPHDQRKK